MEKRSVCSYGPLFIKSEEMIMFYGKMKALTFSYDDGVTQDERLVAILNKYGLKATFNINSELLGKDGMVTVHNKPIAHNKVQPSDVKRIYAGHEVAVHTLTHPNLTQVPEAEVIRQVEEDRKNLEQLVGYEVRGMAYPCGGVNNNEQVAKLLQQHTKVQYARTITSTHSFAPQTNLHQFHPTVFHLEKEAMLRLAKEFLAMQPDTPQIFYIWGHSYEFDACDDWEWFEDFCRMISGKTDVFYGTNREVLL